MAGEGCDRAHQRSDMACSGSGKELGGSRGRAVGWSGSVADR